jgi:hypothetical protein
MVLPNERRTDERASERAKAGWAGLGWLGWGCCAAVPRTMEYWKCDPEYSPAMVKNSKTRKVMTVIMTPHAINSKT